ncbi:MAG: ClbS/DfsB family four-helix bundle protein [Pseudomonadota bacterium]
MAATGKKSLLALTKTEFDKLHTLLATVPEVVALEKDDDATSIKDVVAHRAHWIDLFLGWYADGQAGRPVHMPAEGYKWNELQRYNAMIRERLADLSWAEACALLIAKDQQLRALLEECSGADLYAAPMVGGNGSWTAGRYAESAGSSHYRSAAKYIRGRMRAVCA